jgi:hypothetical protein
MPLFDQRSRDPAPDRRLAGREHPGGGRGLIGAAESAPVDPLQSDIEDTRPGTAAWRDFRKNVRFASRTTGLGLAGELRVADTRIEIQAGDSLDDVARHFNEVVAATGVTASVLATGSGTYRLILAAAVIDDGPSKRLDIGNTRSFADSGRVLEALGMLVGGRDSDANVTSIKRLIDAYHDLADFVDSQLRPPPEGPGATDQTIPEVLAERSGNSITFTPDRVDVLENRLEQRRAQLSNRFTAMERAILLTQSQGAWLESQVKRLPARSG